MFEMKPRAVEKKESSTETDEGLGSSRKQYGSLGSGSAGSAGSMYLSDSQDWVVSPSCSPDEGTGQLGTISPVLAEETLRYMTYLALDPSYSHPATQSLSTVLSADCVEQMTKTYNDMEAVTHLLAERDRDLQLAAHFGQSLLQRKHLLQERNEALEEQLAQAVDQVHQLQHELSKKDELLRMVASASEESDTDSSASTPMRPPPRGSTATAALHQLESLQNKLQELEEENLTLRSEARQLKLDTVTYEEKEQRLVSDCVKELRESSSQMVSLTDELSQKNEEVLRHQEETAQLLTRILELQRRVKELALEKEELRIHLQASKDAQRQLTAELNELAERNGECVEMLHEFQEEIRELRSKGASCAGTRRHVSYGLYPMDSLAAEIEGSMRRELSLEEEATFQDQRSSQKRVFQTVRSVNASSTTPPIPGSGQSSLVMTAQPFGSTRDELRMGQPGHPGENDLNRALHRLSLRRQNFLSERQNFLSERALGEGDGCSSPTASARSSFSNLSDISISSSVFRTFLPEKLQIVKPIEGSLTLHHWQQLAKPHLATILDPHPGVVTKGFRPLAQDAVYRLSDMEEDEEGDGHGGTAVLEKGAAEQGKEDEEEEEGGITFKVKSSSTPEERKDRKMAALVMSSSSSSVQSDLVPTPGHITEKSSPFQAATGVSTATASPCVLNPGKCQSSTFSTYTITTCRILHPSDITQVTPSFQSSLVVNTPSSMRTGPSTPVTPCRLSLGDSSPPRRPPSGLAKLVLEKGISAHVCRDQNPPESPASSPGPAEPRPHLAEPRPHLAEPLPHPADTFLASRPAELFLQDVYGPNLGRAPHPDLPSPALASGHAEPDPGGVGLVERLRRLGVATVLQDASAPRRDSAMFVSAGGGSLLDGLRRNQSLPAMIGARAGNPGPPPHPTSLDVPPSPWGHLRERRRRLGSASHPLRGSEKH